jgi:hypothetical protein
MADMTDLEKLIWGWPIPVVGVAAVAALGWVGWRLAGGWGLTGGVVLGVVVVSVLWICLFLLWVLLNEGR